MQYNAECGGWSRRSHSSLVVERRLVMWGGRGACSETSTISGLLYSATAWNAGRVVDGGKAFELNSLNDAPAPGKQTMPMAMWQQVQGLL